MSWSGANVPVIGGTILSGATTVVLKGSRYIVEHQMPGMEGGIVENLGKPQPRIEIHGIAYQSGADQFLATLSGFIQSGFQEIHIPSFNSGFYFVASGTGVMFENVRFIYDAGHGYPFYHYVIDGVLSGETSNPLISGTGKFAPYAIWSDSSTAIRFSTSTSSPVTISSGAAVTATDFDAQVKIGWMNGRFWAFFEKSGTSVTDTGPDYGYSSSVDGVTWTNFVSMVSGAVSGSFANIKPYNLSVWFDGTTTNGRVYAVLTGQLNDFLFRYGTPQSGGTIAWSGTQWQGNSTDPNNANSTFDSYVMKDANNGFVWTAVLLQFNVTNTLRIFESTDGGTTWTGVHDIGENSSITPGFIYNFLSGDVGILYTTTEPTATPSPLNIDITSGGTGTGWYTKSTPGTVGLSGYLAGEVGAVVIKNTLYVVGFDNKTSGINFLTYDDVGQTWSAPTIIASGRYPAITTDGSGLFVFYVLNSGQVDYVKSTDLGVTWSAPAVISSGEKNPKYVTMPVIDLFKS